jgi:hypothetical protein
MPRRRALIGCIESTSSCSPASSAPEMRCCGRFGFEEFLETKAIMGVKGD